MKRIDSHQHFWHYDAQDYGWISDEMPELKKDRLPQHLAPLLQEFGFDGCIAVQARQSVKETQFLLELAKENPWILGVVGWLNFCSDNIEEELDKWSIYPLIKGYRHLIQDELDPDTFCTDKAFNHSVDLILNKGLIYEVLIHEKSLPAAIKLCSRHDQSILVLDHLGKPNIANANPNEWKKQIMPLAKQEHVFCKLSGLITEAGKNWSIEQIQPYIDIALECFGPNRLLFGSDWPVCLLAGSYAQVYQLIDKTICQLSQDEQSAIWGGNTCKIYNLDY